MKKKRNFEIDEYAHLSINVDFSKVVYSDLDALTLAVEKWEEISSFHKLHPNAPPVFFNGTSSCALCYLYYDSANCNMCCKGCPVHKKTRKQYCGRTPYFDYYTTYGSKPNRALEKHALSEVRFLTRLLVKEMNK